MSDNPGFEQLFENRPETIFIEGQGSVPVRYIDSEETPLPPVGPSEVYALSGTIGWVALDQEVVVYRAASETAHVLDAVAALLWQCLDGVSTLHDIFADIAEAFGQQLDGIESDLATVVAEWKRDGLVVLAGENEPATGAIVRGTPATGTWRHLVDPPNN